MERSKVDKYDGSRERLQQLVPDGYGEGGFADAPGPDDCDEARRSQPR
jgi:hypothetical protein